MSVRLVTVAGGVGEIVPTNTLGFKSSILLADKLASENRNSV